MKRFLVYRLEGEGEAMAFFHADTVDEAIVKSQEMFGTYSYIKRNIFL